MQDSAFYVQLHLHTSESSACGVSSGADMVRACKDAGYGLIVVTDHFMNANTGCPRHASWSDKVEYLFRGYRAAKAVGDRIGLTVLQGWETYTFGPEYLTYGLDEAFLLDNPDIAQVGGPEYLRRVRRAGGFVVHAHPYRKAYYIPEFTPDHTMVDAWEVFNAAHTGDKAAFNARARAQARRRFVLGLAGSDAHDARDVRGGAMRLPYPVHDMPGLIKALRSGECQIVECLVDA